MIPRGNSPVVIRTMKKFMLAERFVASGYPGAIANSQP